MWLLDFGNTRLKLSRADAAGLGPVLALPHAGPELEKHLRTALASDSAPVWWSSVAADALSARVAGVLAEHGRWVERVETRREALGLRIAYADPARLGVDRFLALLAARGEGGAHLLVSFGSAITVDLLDAGGQHRGGMIGIAPGHARQALAQQLGLATDEIEIVRFERVEWPNGCLGVEKPDQMCTEAIVPGWLVILSANGQEYEFHTDDTGNTVIQAN